MTQNMDNIAAATKIRQEMYEIENTLELKRGEYAERMRLVKEREDQLKIEKEELQKKLVRFYKFIQENEIKKNRSIKKAEIEENIRKERQVKLLELMKEKEILDNENESTMSLYQRYVHYEKYLMKVSQSNENEEFLDPQSIIMRWKTLEENKEMLQKRKKELENELVKRKSTLSVKRQKNKNHIVALQNKLAEMQNNLKNYQKTHKNLCDELELFVSEKGKTIAVVGRIQMACQNLYEKCISESPIYQTRVKHMASNTELKSISSQLQMIEDCILDFVDIIEKHKQKTNEKQLLY